MSSTPIKKLLYSLIFLLFICLSMLFGTAAGESRTLTVPPNALRATASFRIQLNPNHPLPNDPLTWSLSPNNGTATLSGSSTADSDSRASFTLTFHANACGTYTVTMRRAQDPRPGAFIQFVISGKPPCSTGSSSEATEPTKLFIVSGYDQTGIVGQPLAEPFVVRLRDREQDNKPLEGVKVTFTVLTGSGTLSAETVMTDANGRAESTLTLGTAPRTVSVEASVEGISQTEIFNAEATLPPPTPTSLSIISGDNQTGLTGESLANPFVVEVRDQRGDPMGDVTVTFDITGGDGSLSAKTVTTDIKGQAKTTLTLGTEPGTDTVQVSVKGIAQAVTFDAIAELLEFDLSLSPGFNLIHLPLKVRAVKGMPMTIQSVSDLYDALGGADTVHWLTTHDSHTQTWYGYFGDADRGTTADRELTDQTGILANMRVPVSVHLGGDALGTDGSSTLTLSQGSNLVGLPLEDARINRVSDLFTLDGLGGNVLAVIVTDGEEFKLVGRTGDPGDIPVREGQGFIISVQRGAEVRISGGE